MIIVFALYLISNFINNQIPEEKQLLKKVFKRKSVLICFAILLPIIIGVKFTFETLWMFNPIFLVFNNNAVSFAIITMLFYFFSKKLILKDNRIRALREVQPKNQFIKIFRIFIIITWIIAAIFISIPLLGLEILQGEDPVLVDIFYLGFI
ncbi:MAG: hypothetical protein ACFE8G_06150, partial [Candidatus Hermodarchaeota archaeon]